MRKPAALAAASLLLVLSACGNDDAVDPRADGAEQAGGTITVLAAASLTDTFTELAETFEDENPGAEVELSFAGSSDLVAQIQGGAPADVFASVDEANMEKLTADDLVGEPVLFATNTLVIVTPADNPAGVASYADLGRADVDVVTCAPQVPCGSATQRLGEAAGFQVAPVSEEQSVTDVLNKVVTGEADAGLVYVTDAAGAGDDVEAIEVPEAADIVNRYPIAVTSGSEQPDLAQAWVDLVTGEAGRDVLGAAGFGLP